MIEIGGPIHVVSNTFSYDIGLYRCMLSWDEAAKSWIWEIAEHVPTPPHAAERVHMLSKASGNEETAEGALEVMQTRIRRLEHYEGKETEDKYAG